MVRGWVGVLHPRGLGNPESSVIPSPVIEYVDAAHQKLAQERKVPCSAYCSEYGVLSFVVFPPVVSILFSLAGG